MKNLVFNLRTAKAQAEGCAKVTKSSRMAKILTTLTLLLTLGVGYAWGDTYCKAASVKYNTGSDQWWEVTSSTKALGTVTTFKLKGFWLQLTGGNVCQDAKMYYSVTGGVNNNYNIQDPQNWSADPKHFQTESMNIDVLSGLSCGNHTLNIWFEGHGQSDCKSLWYSNNSNNYKMSFTIPGFTTTSTSKTFSNTTVSSTTDATISFGQHYGTALSTNNCALSGTNSTEFEVRSISETGVTVRFKPSSNGSKSATLTITDAHSKTCTIKLSGKTQRAVTYKKGDNGTGSDQTDYKVYNTNLTLRNSGDFTRSYYQQTAWNTNSNGTSGTSYALGATYTSNDALTLYPTWAPNNYDITYKDQGGGAYSGSNSGSLPSSYTYGTGIAALTNGVRTGYLFAGWYNNSGCTGDAVTSISNSANGDKTLYAKWTAITISEVSASPSSGSTGVQTMTVSFKTNVPRNSGYYYRIAEFGGANAGTTGGGFHSNGNLISSGDASTLITSGSFSTINFTSTGVYTSAIEIYTVDPITVQKRVTFTYGAGNYYTVSFDLQGHGSSISTQSILSGGKATAPSPAPTATGYTFGGWYKEPACTNAWNFSTETVTSNKILYAKWTAKNTTVTLDRQGGTTGSTSVTATYDAAMPSTTMPGKTGYSFLGYYGSTGGSGTKYYNTDGSSAHVWDVDASTRTIYANWSENMTTVTVNVSPSGAGTLTVGGSSFTPGNTTTAGVTTSRTVVATAKSGYGFDYWTTGGNATGSATTNTYTLNGNGSGSTGTLTANFYTKSNSGWYMEGADFGGWSKPTTYQFDRAYRDIANTYYMPVTLTASHYWKVHNGSNAYNTNSSTSSDQQVTKGTVYSLSTNETKSSYVSSTMSDVWVVINTGTNKKLWVQDPATYYTITLANGSSGNTNNGAAGTEGTITLTTNDLGNLQTKQYASGERVNIAVTAKSGYYVDDITIGATSVETDVNESSYSGYTTMPSGNTTLTVTYKPIYSVTFGVGTGMSSYGSVSNNLSISSGTNVLTGTSITFTATPNLGYKFVGWYSDAACTASVSTDNPYTVNVTSATTLYAKFAVRNLYIHADFISNWATPAQMTQSTVNRAIYTYTINNMAILASAQVGDAWNTGYHFHFVNTVANPNDNKAYNYNGVQTPTYSGSSIDGVHKTHTENATIEFGLTRKSNVTITLTLQSIDDATKPTLNIAADPIYTITHGDPTHGSYTIKVGSASAVGTSTESVATTTITLAATPATGYHFDHWTVTKAGGGTVTVTSNQFMMPSDDVTVAATFLPTSYDVTLKANGGSGADKVVSATYDAAMPSILKGGGTLTAHSRTGYNFAGYYDDASTGTQYYTNVLGSARAWDKASATNLFAHWSAKIYTITLTQSGETGYGSSGTASVTATYDAALPTIASLPTAAQGYAFMGYYTGHNGTGTQYYGPTGNKLVATYTTAGGIELFAYFKKAEITDITLDNYMFDPVAAGGTGFVIANPTIAPTPVLPVKICWELLYDNGNSVPAGHESQAYTEGNTKPNQVRFSIAGLAAGGYKIKATLRTGDDCSGGTLLSEREVSFTIASGYTVTIQYKDTEGNTIAPSTTSPGKATDWTSISAPTIVGYNFSTWVPGDGITLESSATTNSNRFKATFNGTLTARYTKKRVIYFNNTLGWSNVYVYFYSSNKYWADNYGTGAYAGKYFDGYKPYSDQRHGHMTQIEGTNIWYFDYTAAGYDTYENIAFANMDKSNSGTDNTSNNDLGFFSNTTLDPIQVVRRGDHNASLPMFVPLAGQPKTKLNNNKAEYSNQGYWMNYPENTGYALRLFNSSGVEIDSIPFEFTPDKTMPMSVEYILDGSKTYQFKLYRTDGKWFGNNGIMKAGASGDIGETSWEFKEKDGETTRNNCRINTNAAGTYTFTLDFGNKDGYNYLIGVHYPAAANDFQILYNDNAEWSLGSTHDENWVHPSRIIRARENGVDTISFFVAKDNTPILKARKVSSINASGAITWGSLNISGAAKQDLTVDSSAVYNFKVTQGAAGVINSIQYIGAYTGNYYIRSSALSNKWGNYVDNLDHRMTYSSFSESNANSFGEKYSHYKAKWCPRNTNIAFCIANDYSPCITDTLKQDVGNPYDNTDINGTLNNDGVAGHSGNNAYLDRYSANVRFMWDRKTNKISRAYISAATSGLAQFLVLRAGQELHNENNVAISSSPANSVLLSDNENWIYEARLMIKPGTRFKLYACYAKSPVDPASAQYFRGAYDSDNFTSDDNSVILIGGSSEDYQLARIVYDFKTNRLIAAWMPSGEVSGTNEINADIMVIRDHQESARCITFADASANLSKVKTVYGVMRFNRWILNNRQHPEDQNKDHARPGHIVEDLAEHHPPLPVGQQKSTYERRLYFISFPFDVLVGDIFGFGTYGQYWVIQYYDGLNRAKKGYWMDSKPNWKYVSPTEVAQGYKLEKNQGYILELNLKAMAADNTTFWSNGISTIELYFPSTVNQDILKQTDITIPALSDEYKCTINRGTAEGDRRVKDSYWRCIGVPSYNLYNSALKDGSGNEISWKTNYTWKEDESEFPFIYMWNKTDNTLTPQSTSAFLFQPMHAYLTQIKSAIVWTAVSAKPSSIVARRAGKEATKEYNWRIELKQDTTFLDQTYVRMTDLEQVTDNFDFGQDLIKELNSRSNIYTFIGYEKVAANSMTLHTDQTTVIPVGANITTEGDYTFALPDGADGIGVTLIDEETGTRTNLSAGMDYTVYLEKGTHDNRFWLEISPVQQTPTDIEAVSGLPSEVRKVLIDGILYIVKDGKLFDARGARVE